MSLLEAIHFDQGFVQSIKQYTVRSLLHLYSSAVHDTNEGELLYWACYTMTLSYEKDWYNNYSNAN